MRGEQIAPAAWPIRPSVREVLAEEGRKEGGVSEGKNIKAQSAIQSWENGKRLFAKTTKQRIFSTMSISTES